jgi:hypothetical protein
MVGGITMFVGFVLGSIVSLLTIGTAWIAVRPLYGLTLVAISCVGVYFLLRRKPTVEAPMAMLVE